MLQYLATIVLAGVAITPDVPQGWRAFAVVVLGIGLITKIGAGDATSFADLRTRIGVGWTITILVTLAASAGALVAWALGRSS